MLHRLIYYCYLRNFVITNFHFFASLLYQTSVLLFYDQTASLLSVAKSLKVEIHVIRNKEVGNKTQ